MTHARKLWASKEIALMRSAEDLIASRQHFSATFHDGPASKSPPSHIDHHLSHISPSDEGSAGRYERVPPSDPLASPGGDRSGVLDAGVLTILSQQDMLGILDTLSEQLMSDAGARALEYNVRVDQLEIDVTERNDVRMLLRVDEAMDDLTAMPVLSSPPPLSAPPPTVC